MAQSSLKQILKLYCKIELIKDTFISINFHINLQKSYLFFNLNLNIVKVMS